jgi:hypothetical protein
LNNKHTRRLGEYMNAWQIGLRYLGRWGEEMQYLNANEITQFTTMAGGKDI